MLNYIPLHTCLISQVHTKLNKTSNTSLISKRLQQITLIHNTFKLLKKSLELVIICSLSHELHARQQQLNFKNINSDTGTHHKWSSCYHSQKLARVPPTIRSNAWDFAKSKNQDNHNQKTKPTLTQFTKYTFRNCF